MKNIEFLLIREPYNGKRYTRGELYRKDTNEFICFTLEDQIRNKNDKKIHGETAIGFGIYDGYLRRSPKRKRLIPQLISVHNFKDIQIHSGNSIADTNGCILVGFNRFKNKIWNSRKAENFIVDLIKKNGCIFKIEIR
jgi:hypothetical protein